MCIGLLYVYLSVESHSDKCAEDCSLSHVSPLKISAMITFLSNSMELKFGVATGESPVSSTTIYSNKTRNL